MQTTISMAATTVPRVAYPYKTRNGGATVTIFVPYNCHNHCPFCINKAEYEDMTGFSVRSHLPEYSLDGQHYAFL